MGLTYRSVGHGAADTSTAACRRSPADRVIALAGNPNVGKSTIFNQLTGMHQHTGNWPGKTVACAQGFCRTDACEYLLVDLPGTYSLLAHSAEEQVARDFLCFGGADATIVVCDATCLERNCNLVLQIREICDRVIVCINLMDEAARKGISIDLSLLSQRLGVPVVGTSATDPHSLATLLAALDRLFTTEKQPLLSLPYPPDILQAVAGLSETVADLTGRPDISLFLSLRLLGSDEELKDKISGHIPDTPALRDARAYAQQTLAACGIDAAAYEEAIASTIVRQAEILCCDAVHTSRADTGDRDRRIDRVLTGKFSAFPIMLALLVFIFFLTVTVANIPSSWLSYGFALAEDGLDRLFSAWGAPLWLHGILVTGVFRVTGWVVSVMLPPMAIFFPLFTLLEDIGYLPRVAYNLDRPFRRCSACGKQALTMCMGFGCNAAGVVGCRIIDSPRERKLALLTNAFVPCNGRFPTLLTLIGIFFVGTGIGLSSSLASAAFLTLFVLLSVAMTFLATWLLSRTLLRGEPSSFTLELPPYRRPRVLQILIRSVFDRTLFVLLRAVAVAAPAGAVIWILSNTYIDGISLLARAAAFLDPFAVLLGLDGVILLAFLLGFPANEIVLPIVLMAYTAGGALSDTGSAADLYAILSANGWSAVTALSFLLFSLFHWPCSTTLLTIRKETGRLRDVFLAAALPTAFGLLLCFSVHAVALLFGL